MTWFRRIILLFSFEASTSSWTLGQTFKYRNPWCDRHLSARDFYSSKQHKQVSVKLLSEIIPQTNLVVRMAHLFFSLPPQKWKSYNHSLTSRCHVKYLIKSLFMHYKLKQILKGNSWHCVVSVPLARFANLASKLVHYSALACNICKSNSLAFGSCRS